MAGSDRVIKGGSVEISGARLRASRRNAHRPDGSYPTVGFRCAR